MIIISVYKVICLNQISAINSSSAPARVKVPSTCGKLGTAPNLHSPVIGWYIYIPSMRGALPPTVGREAFCMTCCGPWVSAGGLPYSLAFLIISIEHYI